MSMSNFLRIGQRNRSNAAASSSAAPPVTHHAGSRRLEKSRSLLSQSSSLSLEGSATPGGFPDAQSKEYPADTRLNTGISFHIEWDNVWLGNKRLEPGQLGFRVKHLSNLRGGRKPSPVWRHGADLQYTDDAGTRKQIWLCKTCHGQGLRDAAKLINGYAHVNTHLLKEHRIDVSGNGNLLPDAPRAPNNPWEAAAVAGSSRATNHTPWQEEAFQASVIDWVILQDQSFLNASSAELRGILTWNRHNLLNALPTSPATVSSYVHHTLVQRKAEIRTILRMAQSKIALSFDIWTSLNHLSFLGVVAHFVGRCSLLRA
jgi:hypothetical protein